MVVEDAQTGYVGAVVRVEYGRMELEDRHGRRKPFPIGPGYLIDGQPVILDRATTRGADGAGAHRIRLGGGTGEERRVALASRIYVEGRHDAELVEQVWGDDLRVEGVVVEYLGGVDDLVGIVEEFRPGPGRRLGVLVDHLVAGSKEARIAEAVRRGPGGAHTLVVGPSLHRHLAGRQARPAGHLGVAGDTAGHGLEARRVPGAGLAAQPAGRHRQGVAADPGPGAGLERPRARAHRPRRGADRLRDAPHGVAEGVARGAVHVVRDFALVAISGATRFRGGSNIRIEAPGEDGLCSVPFGTTKVSPWRSTTVDSCPSASRMAT